MNIDLSVDLRLSRGTLEIARAALAESKRIDGDVYVNLGTLQAHVRILADALERAHAELLSRAELLAEAA